MRKVSSFVFWVLVGLAVVVVPIACGSNSTSDDGGKSDSAPSDMTKT